MKRTSAPKTYEERITVLFDFSPRDFYEIRSSLTLLRREARTNFQKQQSIWSGAMCVMAGIDLAAKFYADTDSNRFVGDRFKTYLIKMMQLSKREADLVYHARNSFFHSFGLYSQEKTKSSSSNYFIHPRYDSSGKYWQHIVRETWSDGKAQHFELGIDMLFKKFESSLELLKAELLDNRRKNFEELFDRYGTDKPLFEDLTFYDYCNIHKLSSRFK